ncbi:MAG: hypothetical protein VW169_09755 [Rhodospirillaceae bacterium]
MEFIIGSEDKPNTLIPSEQTLQMAGAGAFVRGMLALGVPPDTVSIGIRKGNPDKVTLWFYIRSPNEVGEYYDRLFDPDADAGEE